jgi:hypothetical protein
MFITLILEILGKPHNHYHNTIHYMILQAHKWYICLLKQTCHLFDEHRKLSIKCDLPKLDLLSHSILKAKSSAHSMGVQDQFFTQIDSKVLTD